MATLRQASAQLHPLQDSSDNNNIYDVTGNKTDTAVFVVGTNKSTISYIKGILSYLTNTIFPLLGLIKTKTDLIPSDVTTDTSVTNIIETIEAVPAQNSTLNTVSSEVVGNKTDYSIFEESDTERSIIAYSKAINDEMLKISRQDASFGIYGGIVEPGSLADKLNSIQSDIAAPAQNSIDNSLSRDVIGNKTDGSGHGSLYGLSKLIIEDVTTILEALNYSAIEMGGYPPVNSLSIGGMLRKLDNYESDGLLGTHDSLAYRVNEIERHFHSNERWFAMSATPSGTINVADRIGTSASIPFTLDAGNNTWGSWVAICGSGDTPNDGTALYFDLHSLQTTANERNATYFLQIGYGTTGADVLTNNTYTEKALTFDGINNEKDFTVQGRRIPAGSIVWARTYCPGQNTATISFYYGIHEYEG